MNRSRSRHDGRRNPNQGNPRPENPNQNRGDGQKRDQNQNQNQVGGGRPRRGGHDQHRHQNNQPRRDRPQPQNQNQNQNQGQQKKFGKVVESHTLKKYGIIFYDTLQQAKNDIANLTEKAKSVDQLNIVIKAEADMKDPQLNQFGVLFAGAAWHLIHTRRVEEGWYNEPR